MKKEGQKWMLVALALLAVVTVTLPLVGCKNDTVAEQTGDGTGSGSGNQGTGDGTGSGDGNQGTGDGTGSGSGNQGSGDPEQPVTYTVFFNANNGTGSIDSQTIVRGQTATKPADPTLENNVFGGWYSDEELTSEYDFTTPVTG
ncbi:MAG: InlB B-repeat-containing protein, partial [Spirochaetaceae bacterium]|nr:InlB B-repeat-containing protein [Spirochaetaceae bacterium]